MEQLKVILVDDEPIVIQDMISIIDWNKYGFCIAGTAHSAAGALKLMRLHTPDVVFVDVSMPSMDGLELSEKLKEINPSVIIVILSGYMDFGYAQRAISLGIQSYLVKHQLTEQVLIEELEKIKNTIRKRRKDSNLLRSQVIQCILGTEAYFENISGEEMAHLKEYETPFVFLLVTPILPCLNRENETAPIYFHASAMHKSLGREGLRLLDVFVVEGDLLVTLRPGAGASKTALLEELRKISMCLRENLDVPMFAVCFAHTTVLEEFYYDYHLLRRYCGQYIFEGRNPLLIVENTRTYTGQGVNTGFLCEHMFLHDFQGMRQNLEQGFHKSILTKNSTSFHQYCDGLLSFIRKMDSQYTFSHSSLFSSSDAREVRDMLMEELDNFHREYCVREKYSPMSNYIIRYINANYHLAPTLNEIADQLNSNSVYVGQKFRKDTGMTFNEYLTERRIRHAKSLLVTTNLKTAEIAGRSGFSGSQYFSRIFKEQTGMTPIEYRQRFTEL
ncbi:response regulator [Blautia schinkii]|nr:response regulator [Blautia schinkii]